MNAVECRLTDITIQPFCGQESLVVQGAVVFQTRDD